MFSAGAALGAQSPAVQLAFGYEGGDRFLIKNDGNQPVTVEWKATGSQDRSTVHLNANESREIASASGDAVQLWVSGKVVATEPKGNKSCRLATLALNPPGDPGRRRAAARLVLGQRLGRRTAVACRSRLSSLQGGVSSPGRGFNGLGRCHGKCEHHDRRSPRRG